MNLDKYIKMKNTVIPQEMKEKLLNSGGITKTKFDDKDDVLTNSSLHNECGYELMENGSYYLVSMSIPMPKVTKEMVEWWFWWHASDSKRYKAWYPKEHKSISYNKKDKEYFQSKTVPPFKEVTHYPVERVGKLSLPLSIDFVSPENFGFSKELIKNAEIIVCGHVGAFKGLIPNTEMAHCFFKAEDGLILVSRFWLGIRVKNKLIRKMFVTKKQAKAMAEHCYVEYHNFVKKIPLMYEEWLEEINK